jgi:RNA polymerase sigma factor (sigma-70 family)
VVVVPINDSVDTKHNGKGAIDDFDLVQKCLNNDTQSFRLLYQRHSPKVRSILYQLCEPSCLDDSVQEVFLRVWKGLPKFRTTAAFSTWLYRITWNVASDNRQAKAQKDTQFKALSENTLTEQEAPDLMKLHYQDLVQKGLANLSFDHRTILVLHDLEEVPQKEVAEVLKIPLGTVKSRLFHARAAMRQFLIEQGVQL